MERLSTYTAELAAREDGRVLLTPPQPKGMGFVRYLIARALAKRDGYGGAAYIARERWSDTSSLVRVLDAEAAGMDLENLLTKTTAPGTTTDSSWAGPLSSYRILASEFFEAVRPMTILGKVQGLRKVPFDTRVPVVSAGTTLGWVGEGNYAPVSALAFTTVSLTHHKISGVMAISNELAKMSRPSAEALIRRDLLDAAQLMFDQSFIDPAIGATPESPASITNGVTPLSSSGSTAAQIGDDLAAMVKALADANHLVAPYWVMRPADAAALALKRDAGGAAFPGIGVNGGELAGIPVITSNAVPYATTAGSIVVLFDAAAILYADDGEAIVDVSQNASIQMESAPSPGSQSLTSMFQTDSTAIKVTAYRTWERVYDDTTGSPRQATAVVVLDGVMW